MNKDLAKSIGTAARAARKALQLTQEDAAERIDVSVEFYARIERGTSLPSIETFARIVSALGVSADALLGRPVTGLPEVSWTPAPPTDSPEMRRVTRRLRKAKPSTVRLVNLLLKELDRLPTDDSSGSEPGNSDSGSSDASTSSASGEEDDDDDGGMHLSARHISGSASPFNIVAFAK